MKLNKNALAAALFAAALTMNGAVARAQDSANPPATPPPAGPGGGAAGPGGARMHGPNIEAIAKQLGLTDDQKAKFQSALEGQRQKMKDLMSDQSLSKEDRRTQMKQLREDLNTQLQGILTADQFTKWQKMMAHHRPPQRPSNPNAASTNAPASN